MSSRVLFLSCALAIAACSSSSSPSARVYLDSQLTAGSAGAAACGIVSPVWVTIGTSASPTDDGSSQDNGTVSVSCTVSSNSDGTFNVIASAVVSTGGSVTLNSTPGHGFATSGTQSNVHAVFQRGDTGKFEESDCTITYDDQNGVKVGVAAGRVGGTLDCPTAQDPNVQEKNPDGGADIPRTCHATAMFRFENCNQ